MRIVLLCLFFLCFGMQDSFADTTKVSAKRPIVVRLDSTKLQLRSFDAAELKAYKAQKDFIYDDEAPVGESLWDRFWKWFWGVVNRIFGDAVSGTAIKYLLIAAFVALLAFVIAKSSGLNLFMFSKRSKPIAVPYHEAEENIHELNFSEEIEKATSAGNYRLAIRLFYLLSLKKLSDRQLIHWLPEKTNQHYLEELEDKERRAQFSALTRQFEYVWYGEFMINREVFNQFKASFDQFNADLS